APGSNTRRLPSRNSESRWKPFTSFRRSSLSIWSKSRRPTATSFSMAPSMSSRQSPGSRRCRSTSASPRIGPDSRGAVLKTNRGLKMSITEDERHPFLDDLTADAELISSVLRGPVIGRDEIRLAVDAVGTFYASQTPVFLETVGSRLFLEYEAVLTSG